MTLAQELTDRLVRALHTCGVELPGNFTASVVPAQDPRFGDYQTNAAMVAGKAARTNPRELAARVAEAIDGSGLCAPPEIAGPGFINFRVEAGVLAERVAAQLRDDRCGVGKVDAPRTIVVDFSAPNIAKPMHVGHIRSTILGDALAGIARFLGHRVITDNHIGDWGTQFGMILHGWKTGLDQQSLEADPVAELLRLYRQVNAEAKADVGVLGQCKAELVRLQAGDEENLAIWRRCVELSRAGLEKIYARLGVTFDHWLGESFYNDRLPGLVEELLASGLATESDGAICLFSGGDLKPEDDPFLIRRDDVWMPNPSIIRKADGGYLYATTDLATLEHRLDNWQADEIWYVVGAPQQLHFRQVFDAARRWGKTVRGIHVAFGSILGEDRKLMKTRSGDNVQLADVLDEAVVRARKVIEEKNAGLDDAEKNAVAETVGIGAVKYAELSQHRLTDYVFSWDRMLALQGNTAPYLQNAYVRIQAIFRKAGLDPAQANPGGIRVFEEAERALAVQLARFAEAVPAVLDDHRPNLLANYLYDLATAFHGFYEACPVLKAEDATRASRLALSAATAKVLRTGLGLLGIGVPERM